MKILLVEDEIEMQKKYHRYLELEKNIVEIWMILIVLYKYEYDCVLLDITLPNGNGLDLKNYKK
jgi:DNA-binding response OmpR family regulator